MRLRIYHLTCYAYAEAVPYSILHLRLTPRNSPQQTVMRWQHQAAGETDETIDAYGNCAHTLVLSQTHQALTIAVSGEVETHPVEVLQDALPPALFLRQTALTQADAALQAFATAFAHATPLALMHAIRVHMPYQSGLTQADTSAAQAFAAGGGVCQDHTHVFISCCRLLGWPARYVSGYLYTAEGGLLQTHAWAELWQAADGGGWRGLDISNGNWVDERYVRLACGLDYRSAAPISGTRMGGQHAGMASQVQMTLGSPLPRYALAALESSVMHQAQQQLALHASTAALPVSLAAGWAAQQ